MLDLDGIEGVSGGLELFDGHHSLITRAKRKFSSGATTFTGENEHFTGERVTDYKNTYRKTSPPHTKKPHHEIGETLF
ncbi:hypothetical protein [Fictibacillus norfolkensis]|uniref:hypothetical protein n=1 Tax=Fictibacillus norfolkensis TaxID=2762233 RepID=UPI001785EBA5|nr:hypothetical protein [Fictibacillus norfolkensis]